MSNILYAIKNVVENPITELKSFYTHKNRINQVGEALECYVQDIFAGTIDSDESARMLKMSETFSYMGNNSNPPDIILKGGDAIETKKIQSASSALALNSSYPKAKLYADSPMLNKACRACESWDVKDMIYAVGHTNDNELKCLWLVAGDCFCADKDVYENIKTRIKEGVSVIDGVSFAETKELGKVKRVDPLGITDLRIRGMWHIQNPHAVFSYLNCIDNTKKFQFLALIRKSKYDTFSEDEKQSLLSLTTLGLKIQDVKIKNPDNPAQLLDSVLFSFYL